MHQNASNIAVGRRAIRHIGDFLDILGREECYRLLSISGVYFYSICWLLPTFCDVIITLSFIRVFDKPMCVTIQVRPTKCLIKSRGVNLNNYFFNVHRVSVCISSHCILLLKTT